MPSLTVTTAGRRDDVDVAAARDLLLAAQLAPSFSEIPLMPVTHGQPELVGDADRDLVVARVGGLVAEQDQV